MRPKASPAILISALLLAVSSPAPAHESGSERRTITVNGRGEVSAKPDLAVVYFAVETQAATAGAAAEQNAAVSTKVAAAVQRLLGPDDELTTTRYTLQPRYENMREPGDPKIVGYTASNEVQVETAAIDGVGKLIDAAIAAGANRVNNLMFTVKDRNPHIRKALEQAGAEARAQAEAAARALNVQLKQVVSATTMSPPIVFDRVHEAFGHAAMKQAATPVEPGEVKVSAELSVAYEIE